MRGQFCLENAFARAQSLKFSSARDEAALAKNLSLRGDRARKGPIIFAAPGTAQKLVIAKKRGYLHWRAATLMLGGIGLLSALCKRIWRSRERPTFSRALAPANSGARASRVVSLFGRGRRRKTAKGANLSVQGMQDHNLAHSMKLRLEAS